MQWFSRWDVAIHYHSNAVYGYSTTATMREASLATFGTHAAPCCSLARRKNGKIALTGIKPQFPSKGGRALPGATCRLDNVSRSCPLRLRSELLLWKPSASALLWCRCQGVTLRLAPTSLAQRRRHWRRGTENHTVTLCVPGAFTRVILGSVGITF